MECEQCGAQIDRPVRCVMQNGETFHYDLETDERIPRVVGGEASLKVKIVIGDE